MFWSVCIPMILTAVIGLAIVKVFFQVGMYVTFFSRLAVGVLITALAAVLGPRLVENGWVNFGIWAAIVLGIGGGLCLLPRIRCTLSFLCNVLIVELFVTLLVYLLLPSIFSVFQITTRVSILVQAVCFGYALWLLILQVGQTELHDSESLLLRVFDRLLASILNGIIVNVGIILFFPSFYITVFQFVLCQAGLIAVFYAGDLLLFKRLFPVDVPYSAASALFERVKGGWANAQAWKKEWAKMEEKWEQIEEREEERRRRDNPVEKIKLYPDDDYYDDYYYENN